MAITWGTSWQSPVDFGVSEWISNKLGTQVGAYNPAQHPQAIGPETKQNYDSTGKNTAFVPQSDPKVLGATTGGTSNVSTTNPTSDPVAENREVFSGTNTGPSAEDILRGQIEGGWNAWEGGMNDIFNTLPGQANNQNQMIQNQFQQGRNTLDNQLREGQGILDTQEQKTMSNQESNLKSLADSLRNQFLQGQVMLGSRGAGDSSAANMYSYALSKLGSKERSSIMNTTAGIMNEIGQRETKLKNDYDTNIRNLELERDNQIGQVAQWLAEQQNSIRAQIADGKLRKSQDIAQLSQNFLNQALGFMQQAQGQFDSRKNALTEWAMSNAQTIDQLKANLAGVSNYAPTMPQFGGIFGQPTMDAAGNMMAKYYGGYSDEEKKQV